MTERRLTHGSLFSGIGGFDLGFDRAGIDTIWQVEYDPYCQKVLEKQWPHVERFKDVRKVGKHNLKHVDIISGGFPCQDISTAGNMVGLSGKRSGLWFEYLRIIRELRPNFIVVENVPALIVRGLDRVLGGLAACGYDAEWQSIRASDLGAPHRRERIWIVAYPNSLRELQPQGRIFNQRRWFSDSGTDVAYPNGVGWKQVEQSIGSRAKSERSDDSLEHRRLPSGRGWWKIEPNVGRVADGVPKRVDRLRALGNAIVPQISEWIGRRIVESLVLSS